MQTLIATLTFALKARPSIAFNWRPALSPRDFLLEYPSGAYTTMRTVGQTSVLNLSMHVDRIVHGCSMLHLLPPHHSDSTSTESVKVELALAVRHLISSTIEHYISASRDRVVDELKVTVLYYVRDDQAFLVAHCDALAPALPGRVVDVEVQGSPRNDSSAKDSQWVRDREVLKKQFETTHEILLHVNGDIYEGMTSNFFALSKSGTIYTAPLDKVLPGTMQELVIAACRDTLNIPLIFQFPNINQAATEWAGAFLTSTSRMVLPIGRILTPAPDSRWIDLQSGESEIIKRLQLEMMKQLALKAEPISTLPKP
eukprot:Partr_v1_DN25891_c2_g1_i1_m3003 putative Aminotransferase class IV